MQPLTTPAFAAAINSATATAVTTGTATDHSCIGQQLHPSLQLASGVSTDAGEGQVWVWSTDGKPLSGAPFLLKVKPAAVCPGNCQVSRPLSVIP